MLNHLSSGQVLRHRTSTRSPTLLGSTSTMPRKTQVQYGEQKSAPKFPLHMYISTVKLTQNNHSEKIVLLSIHIFFTKFLFCIKICNIFLAKGKYRYKGPFYGHFLSAIPPKFHIFKNKF